MVNNKKGFTLIELLVVIAIIGILASVVLASLNSARSKGADASIKSNMANIRAQAELWYDNNGQTYGASSVCTAGSETGVFTDTVITSAISQIETQNGTGTVTCATSADGQSWAIMSPLKSTGTWCVDNTGSAGSGTSVTNGLCA